MSRDNQSGGGSGSNTPYTGKLYKLERKEEKESGVRNEVGKESAEEGVRCKKLGVLGKIKGSRGFPLKKKGKGDSRTWCQEEKKCEQFVFVMKCIWSA